MSSKTHVVAVIGVMKVNGQMAMYGEEVSKEDFDNGDIKQFADRVEGDYLKPIKEFKKELTDVEKEKLSTQNEDAERASNSLKAHNKLLEDYKKSFKTDAPAETSDDDLQKAIDTKTPLIIQ